jgi:hypothetical protein
LITLVIVSAVGFFFVQRHRKGLPLIPSRSEHGRFGTVLAMPAIRPAMPSRMPSGDGGYFTRFTDSGSSRDGRRARTMPAVNVVAPPSDGGTGGYQAPTLTALLSMGSKGSASLSEPLSLRSMPHSASAGQSQL